MLHLRCVLQQRRTPLIDSLYLRHLLCRDVAPARKTINREVIISIANPIAYAGAFLVICNALFEPCSLQAIAELRMHHSISIEANPSGLRAGNAEM